MINPLSSFGDWHSDKRAIGLLDAYEQMFAIYKDKPITYLEVGIAHGESMEWAKEYFAKGSRIIGFDLYEPDMQPKDTEFYYCDQNDTSELRRLGKLLGPFDIIIDDGCHVRKPTENTFNALYQFLKPDGFYIIEDWGAGYLPSNPHCKGMETLVTELIWKYGGTIYNGIANLAVIDSATHRGYGGFARIGRRKE